MPNGPNTYRDETVFCCIGKIVWAQILRNNATRLWAICAEISNSLASRMGRGGKVGADRLLLWRQIRQFAAIPARSK